MSDIQDLTDRLAIRELVERYSTAVTTRNWDEMASVFHPDAVWSVSAPLSFELRGLPEIAKGLTAAIAPWDFLVQMCHSAVITLDGDRATVVVVVQEMARRAEGDSSMFIVGTYHDEVTRVDGRWGFARRFFQCISVEGDGPDFPLNRQP